MKSQDLYNAMNGLDPKLIEGSAPGEQVNMKKQSKKTWLKWGSMAACLCFVVGMTAFAVRLMQNRLIPDIPLDTNSPVLNNDPKLPLSSLPGAMEIDLSNAVAMEDIQDKNIYTPEEYTEVLKRSFTTVIGRAENICSVTVKDGDFVWCITSFDIAVTEAINRADGIKLMRCVTAIQCFDDGSPTMYCGISDVGKLILEDPQGFYVARPVGDELWELGSQSFALSDFADYYVGIKMDCTDEHFCYYGMEIKIDDIRDGDAYPFVTMQMQADWPYYQTASELADASTHVFRGEVTDISFAILNQSTGEVDESPNSETEERLRMLYTVYTVAVQSSYKGEADAEIEICIMGGLQGYRENEQYALMEASGLLERYGGIVLCENDEPMATLAIGKKYLFCTSAIGNFHHTVNPLQFAHHIESENSEKIINACK